MSYKSGTGWNSLLQQGDKCKWESRMQFLRISYDMLSHSIRNQAFGRWLSWLLERTVEDFGKCNSDDLYFELFIWIAVKVLILLHKIRLTTTTKYTIFVEKKAKIVKYCIANYMYHERLALHVQSFICVIKSINTILCIHIL